MKKLGKLNGKPIVETSNKNRLSKNVIDIDSLKGGEDARFYKFEINRDIIEDDEEVKNGVLGVFIPVVAFLPIEGIFDFEDMKQMGSLSYILINASGVESADQMDTVFNDLLKCKYIKDTKTDNPRFPNHRTVDIIEMMLQEAQVPSGTVTFTEVSKEEYMSSLK